MSSAIPPTENIYSPPAAELKPNQLKLPPYELATRLSRLAAIIIDTIVGLVVNLPFWQMTNYFDGILSGHQPPLSILIGGVVYGVAAYLLVHGYLLKKYGQTIGKRVMGIYIANIETHEKASLMDILLKRFFPVAVINIIPIVGPYLGLIDALFIFRKDQRCVHDHIANTHVLKK